MSFCFSYTGRCAMSLCLLTLAAAPLAASAMSLCLLTLAACIGNPSEMGRPYGPN